MGKATKVALLTAVDIEALKADLKEVIAKAESDDPKALRKRIEDSGYHVEDSGQGAVLTKRV